MDEPTASLSTTARETAVLAEFEHPVVDGYTLVTTPPLPPFLQGGFGRVYRALTPDGVLVAIKVPAPRGFDSELRTRWLEECHLSLALPPHEHLVTFFARSTARWPNGLETPALVMEWLEGARGLIPYSNAVGLDRQERLSLFTQAVEGVAWLHDHGTPHLDLKSGNMLVIERGGPPLVKIADFGGTRRGRFDPRPPVFSIHRAAPEVIVGDPAAINARADVYALGKELAELVGGAGASSGTRENPQEWRPMPLDQVTGLPDPGLDAIIARATAQEPAQRYSNGKELLAAMRRYRPPARQSLARSIERWMWSGDRPRRWPIVAAITVLGLLVGVLSLMGLHSSVAFGIGPELLIRTPAPREFRYATVFRDHDGQELDRIASMADIPGVVPGVPGSRRRVWAKVIERVAAARPASIVLDIVFPSLPDAALNRVIADAIIAARLRGIPVVVAVTDYQKGRPDLHDGRHALAAEVVEAGATWGCFQALPHRGVGKSVFIPSSPEGELRLPLAVAAVASVLGDPPPAQPQLVRESGVLLFPGDGNRGRSVGLFGIVDKDSIKFEPDADLDAATIGFEDGDVVGVYPVSMPPDSVLSTADHSVLDLWTSDPAERARIDGTIRGRVVVLAAMDPRDTHEVEDGRVVPGALIHLSAIEGMLQGRNSPRPTARAYLIAVACGLAGVAMGILLGAGVLQRMKVPPPSMSGQWSTSPLRRPVAARRWRRCVITWLLIGVIAAIAWLASPRVVPWSITYFTGAAIVGGVCAAWAGFAVAMFGSWIGLVRRAWCLDRAESVPGTVPTPAAA